MVRSLRNYLGLLNADEKSGSSDEDLSFADERLETSPALSHAKARIRHAPIRAICTLVWDNGARKSFGQVDEIQPNGCIIKTESTIKPGTRLALEITILGLLSINKIELTGRVESEMHRDERRAYEIGFVPQSAHEQEIIDQVCSEIRR